MSLLGYLKGFLGATRPRLNAITRSYLQAALWSSTDEDGVPMDRNYSESDFSAAAMSQADRDTREFEEANSELYTQIGIDSQDAGKLFWLTRNGHGVSFTDNYRTGTVEDQIAKRLDVNARKFGEANVMTGDDGELEIFTG